jgi:hypothetical protein
VLYEAAHEPKELMWMPGGHIDRRDEATIRKLCALVVSSAGDAPPK